MKKVIAVALSSLAVCCLIAAGLMIIKDIRQDQQANEIWETLRPSDVSQTPSTQETTDQVKPKPITGSEASSESAAQSSDSRDEQTSDTPGDSQASNAPGDGTVPSQTPDTPSTESSAEPSSESPSEPEATEEPQVPNPYADSFLANADMAAWLTIPGTVIDYPVMWTPRDENYYLYKDFNGKENKNGCLILDTDSCLDPLTTNLIIHGHNMKSGDMFGDLTDYTDPAYCESHKQIILHTQQRQRNYEVIAVFRSQVFKKTDNVFKFYKFFQANTEEEFNDFYDNIKKLSLYDTGVTAQFGDRFITLSTCVYHVTNGRFVVVAKEVESGDAYLPLK